MAGFISTVRFLVKHDCVDDFIKQHNEPGGIDQAGVGLNQYLIRTGDRTFTWIGMFDNRNCRRIKFGGQFKSRIRIIDIIIG